MTAFAKSYGHTLLRSFGAAVAMKLTAEGAAPYLKSVYGGLGGLLVNLVLSYGQQFAIQTSVSIGYVVPPGVFYHVFVGCFKYVTLTLTYSNVPRHVCPSSLL